MIETPPMPTDKREQWATLLSMRAQRLIKLIQLKAPELIIENERRLVKTALENLPVNSEAAAEADARDLAASNDKKLLS